MTPLKNLAAFLETKGMNKYASELKNIDADIKKLLPEEDWWKDRARQLGRDVPADAPGADKEADDLTHGIGPTRRYMPFGKPVLHPSTPVNVAPQPQTFAEPGETVEELTPGQPSRLISWLIDPTNKEELGHVPELDDVIKAINSGKLTYSRIQQEAAKAPPGKSKEVLKGLLNKLHAYKYKMASELVNYVSACLKEKGYDTLYSRLKTAASIIRHPDEHSIPSIETVHEGSPEVKKFENNLKKLAEVYAHISSLVKSFLMTYRSESKKLSKDPKEEAVGKLVVLVTKEDAEVEKIIKSFKASLPAHPINK
jgi:hypothetical protein